MGDKFTRIGFILSIVGAAIGLGNAWKFPYMTGANGGSAFVLIYLVFTIIVGLSIFFAEIAMGKLSTGDVAKAFYTLAPKHKRLWSSAGIMMITGVLVASFYTMIIGWVIKYAVLSLTSLPASVDIAQERFVGFISKDITGQIFYYTIAFFGYFFILAKGIKSGIERLNLWLMPMLFVLLMLMLGYSASMSGFSEALEFLLSPDFTKVSGETIFMALGLAFFTMCVGIGAIITYSANLNDNTNLFTSSLYVVALNLIISIVIGLIVFTFVFEFNGTPNGGPGLVFITLPTLFASINVGVLGNVLSFAFFSVLIFAGLTSAISMVEPLIFYFNKSRHLSRNKAILIVGGLTYILGMLCILGQSTQYADVLTFANKSFFDWLDFIASNIMLPVGGIIICFFVGWSMRFDEIQGLLKPYMGAGVFEFWYFCVRFIAPACVLAVLIKGLL